MHCKLREISQSQLKLNFRKCITSKTSRNMQVWIGVIVMQSGPVMLVWTVCFPGPFQEILGLWAVDNVFNEASTEDTVRAAPYYFNVMWRWWHGCVGLNHQIFIEAFNVHLKKFRKHTFSYPIAKHTTDHQVFVLK